MDEHPETVSPCNPDLAVLDVFVFHFMLNTAFLIILEYIVKVQIIDVRVLTMKLEDSKVDYSNHTCRFCLSSSSSPRLQGVHPCAV